MEQMMVSFRMSNRLAAAEIRLKKANRLSEEVRREPKEIRDSLGDLSDSLILRENVRVGLTTIESKVAEFEKRIAA